MTGTVLLIRIVIAIVVILAIAALIRWVIRFNKKEKLLERHKVAMEANYGDGRKRSILNSKSLESSEATALKSSLIGAPEISLPIIIMARTGKSFSGSVIVNLVRHFGFQYSEKQTYELIAEDGVSTLCSMHDLYHPGILPTLESLETGDHQFEGVLLLLQLPVSDNPVKDWETFSALVYDMTEVCSGRIFDCNNRPISDRDLARYKAAAAEYEEELLKWLSTKQQ